MYHWEVHLKRLGLIYPMSVHRLLATADNSPPELPVGNKAADIASKVANGMMTQLATLPQRKMPQTNNVKDKFDV